ncbi:phage tail protein [Pseudomonas idahonensis]|uniref:phage tail protein n=1 Tax=Pseudomonas idahonensis TaxID=2942628 RepID=UPI0030D0A7C1
MVNQNSIFGGMLTSLGAAKKTNCDALGIPWEPSYMLIGDANDTDPVPSPGQTQLIRQVYRAPLNALYVSPTDDKVLIAELVLPPEVGGWWIRELAIEDKDGVFCAVANVAPSYKPLLAQGSGRNQVVRMHIITNSTTNIQLKIDPSVVLATRSYVDQRILEELNKQDFKHSVLVATTGVITLSGLQTVDSVALAAGNRVLVKNQAQAKDNGLYVAAAGAWSRTQDADTSLEVTPGLFVSIETGTVNGDSVWQLVTDGPIVLGTTPLAFEMATGRSGVSAGSYTNVTVDKYGRVIAGTNPSTLAGHGITDTYTKPETAAAIQQAIASLVASSPAALDTLKELADALGNDPNFATTMTNALAGKAGKATTLAGYGIADAFTKPETTAAIQQAIASLVASSPAALDTLKELAAALGNDPNFATTMTNALAGKAGKATTLGGYNINDAYTKVEVEAIVKAQATETVRGAVRIGTIDDVNAGNDDTAAVTSKKLRWGITLILGPNGAVAFPSWLGGLVIQWGTVSGIAPDTSLNVSFPMAFTTACYSLTSSVRNAPGTTWIDEHSTLQWRSVTNSGFLACRQQINDAGSAAANWAANYIAIGK